MPTEPSCPNPVRTLRIGDDPLFDAWFYTFRAENNIEYHINPQGVASDEQLGFMVDLPDNGVYVPCDDIVFQELMRGMRERTLSPLLLAKYGATWRMVVRLLRDVFTDRAERRTMLAYCRLRFQSCLALRCILPSRLLKRLLSTIMGHTGRALWLEERRAQNAHALRCLSQTSLQQALDALPSTQGHNGLSAQLHRLEHIRLARLLTLAARPVKNLEHLTAGELLAGADDFAPHLSRLFPVQPPLVRPAAPRVVLYLCDSEGSVVQDVAVVNAILHMGHRVILACKDAPFFLAPLQEDFENDPSLNALLPAHHLLRGRSVSKNDLLRRLREHRLLVISDGTSEELNLYRTSTTFARAWKECDIVIAKGVRVAQALLRSSSAFTRDVFCFWEEKGHVRMQSRARASGRRKFSESDLIAKAMDIINEMRRAHEEGKAVMFYSCILGSIPGQAETAVRVANAFVNHLRERQQQVFIINPAGYYEPGMDGDDLMFMWEHVQRSGFINIWRFQSVEDIEIGFSLLGEAVPPVWAGKDATFSTGCTKEMRIALDMRRSHPELQIIGPVPDAFFRRSDYGVGKFFDASLRGA